MEIIMTDTPDETVATEKSDDYIKGFAAGATWAAQAFVTDALPVLDNTYDYLVKCEELLDRQAGLGEDSGAGSSDITCDLKQLADVVRQLGTKV